MSTYMFSCAALNGGWATWGSWGECESHCLKKRTRTCTDPVPNAGGEDCKGNAQETLPCHGNSCGNKIFICFFSKCF